MSEVKTLDDIIKEKNDLARDIEDNVNSFLRNNPGVKDVDIIKSLYTYETHCGEIRDLSVSIKIIL